MVNPPIHNRLESSIVYADVHDERNRAHKKHGALGNSREDAAWTDQEWLPILVEEVGEVAHHLTYDADPDPNVMRKELVQVAAMACAWIAAIDAAEDAAEPKHDDLCASLCTDSAGDGCDLKHSCWCPDGALSYAEYQKAHP